MEKGKLVANRNCGPAWLLKDIENRSRSLVLLDTYSGAKLNQQKNSTQLQVLDRYIMETEELERGNKDEEHKTKSSQ